MAEVSGVGTPNYDFSSLAPNYDLSSYDRPDGAQYNTRNDAEEMKTQFLSLLVAQLKNQDPMNPVDNQEFVAQLATFSSLEQLITINEGIEKVVQIITPAEEGLSEEESSSKTEKE